MNCHTGTVGSPVEILRVSHEVERDQAADLGRRRAGRDQAAVELGPGRDAGGGPVGREHDPADAGRGAG